jgi:protein arginine kinase
MNNINLEIINKTIPGWLNSTDAPKAEVVVSSRLRYARNISGYRFPNHATEEELIEIYELIRATIEKNELWNSVFNEESKLIKIEKLSRLQAEFLLERHLISPDFIRKIKNLNETKEEHHKPYGVFISKNETTSIMINEEDHLRFQVISPGFEFQKNFEKLNLIDDIFEANLQYAFSPDYGYLTACPTNVGTGLRVSVMIHLPGLIITQEIHKAIKAIRQLNCLVRGIYGEGTETRGYFFQISNNITLGESEEEIIQGMKNITKQIIEYEERARDFLLKNMKTELEDKVHRAYAILRSARLLSSDEALNLLATVRLGVATAILNEISLNTLNKIMILLKPANLQIFYNQTMNAYERDEKRAALIRELLNQSVN